MKPPYSVPLFQEEYGVFENLIIISNSNYDEGIVFRFTPEEKWYANHYSPQGLTNYSGKLQVLNLAGEAMISSVYEDGKRVSTDNLRLSEEMCETWIDVEMTVVNTPDGNSYLTELTWTEYEVCDDVGGGNTFPPPTPLPEGPSGGAEAPTVGIQLTEKCPEGAIMSADGCECEHGEDDMGVCLPPVNPGTKPIYEYSNKCSGISSIWSNYPNNEVAGYVTTDGQLLVIDILPYNGGNTYGTYDFNGVTYYPFPDNTGPPSGTYQGMLHERGYYFIPVSASVHTHSPCRTDGTNGVSHQVGQDDLTRAASSPNINHWAIGCNAIGQFNSTSTNFFNVQTGPLSSTCSSIQ